MTLDTQLDRDPRLQRLLEGLAQALGPKLLSVVLYGSAARGEFKEKVSDFNLLVVLQDLEVETLEALAAPMRAWQRSGQPLPRMLTPLMIADGLDVFPLEFMDIKLARVVLRGSDPFESVMIEREPLRLQCERELREKLMRLREGYVETHQHPHDLRRLLIDSYTTFLALFRGCLCLVGDEVPVRNEAVVSAFCARVGLHHAAFDAVDRLRGDASAKPDLKAVFRSYYEELTRALERIDRFRSRQGGA